MNEDEITQLKQRMTDLEGRVIPFSSPSLDPATKSILDQQTAVTYTTTDPATLPNPQYNGKSVIYNNSGTYKYEIFANGGWRAFNQTASTQQYATFSNVEVTNTTTETTLFSFTLPGGTLGTGGVLVCRTFLGFLGMLNAHTLLLNAYYGSGSLGFGGVQIVGNSSGQYQGYIDYVLGANGATNAQSPNLQVFAMQNAGSLVNNNITVFASNGASTGTQDSFAVDSTANQTVKVTAKFGTASASDKIDANYTICYIIK